MKESFKYKLLTLIAGLMFASLLSATETIKIAFIGPTTGPLTQYGDMLREGVLTAIENINVSGGINGKKLEFILEDDACEPKQGPVAANRLVNQKIKFAVGPACSGAAIAALPIYDEEGIVIITPSVTSPQATDGKNYHYFFRTIGRDDQQGPAGAKYILEKAKGKNIAILHDKQSYGQGIATSVRTELKKSKVEAVLFEGINAGDSDYSAIITKLKNVKAEFVYFGGYHPEAGLLLRQSAEQGLKVQILGPEGLGNPQINAIAGDSVEGRLLVTLPADFSANPKNAEIVKSFKDKKRDPSGAFQLNAYAAVQVLAESIKNVGEDTNKVADYLHKNTFETVQGKTSWNKQGDLNSFDFQVFNWNKDGTKTLAK